MKKKIYILIGLILSFITAFGQVPEAFNYQAVLRNASGNVRENETVSIDILLHQGSPAGSAVFSETHYATTNAFGLINLEIGSVNPAGFAAIDWSIGPYFITLMVDGTEMGTSQLLSVPYALYARGVENVDDADADPENELQIISIREDTIYLSNGGYVKLPEGFSGDYNDLSNKPEFVASPNVYIGNAAGKSNTTGYENIALGDSSMYANTDGYDNVALGYCALKKNTSGFANIANGYMAMYSNTTGSDNIANGYEALYKNTDGWGNIANGYFTLHDNTLGTNNTANGFGALSSNITGDHNIATGASAMFSNTTGDNNIAFGSGTLSSNTMGNINIAIGTQVLYANTKGNFNIGLGYSALQKNDSGNYNIGIGYNALNSNISGGFNIAFGTSALGNNTEGFYNVALGTSALLHNTTGIYNISSGYQTQYHNTSGNRNVAYGSRALYFNSTGNRNTALGDSAGYDIMTGSNNIAIGYNTQVPFGNANNQIRLGNTDITYAGMQVAWTVTSDIKWKESIRDLPYGLNFVNKLKPVDYIRKNNQDKIREAGFIAQDVEVVMDELEIVNSGLISKGYDGSLELRYNDFIPILTKAIQEQQAIIEDLKARIETLEDHHNSKTSEDAH